MDFPDSSRVPNEYRGRRVFIALTTDDSYRAVTGDGISDPLDGALLEYAKKHVVLTI